MTAKTLSELNQIHALRAEINATRSRLLFEPGRAPADVALDQERLVALTAERDRLRRRPHRRRPRRLWTRRRPRPSRRGAALHFSAPPLATSIRTGAMRTAARSSHRRSTHGSPRSCASSTPSPQLNPPRATRRRRGDGCADGGHDHQVPARANDVPRMARAPGGTRHHRGATCRPVARRPRRAGPWLHRDRPPARPAASRSRGGTRRERD